MVISVSKVWAVLGHVLGEGGGLWIDFRSGSLLVSGSGGVLKTKTGRWFQSPAVCVPFALSPLFAVKPLGLLGFNVLGKTSRKLRFAF
jgi:hypothetical protein